MGMIWERKLQRHPRALVYGVGTPGAVIATVSNDPLRQPALVLWSYLLGRKWPNLSGQVRQDYALATMLASPFDFVAAFLIEARRGGPLEDLNAGLLVGPTADQGDTLQAYVDALLLVGDVGVRRATGKLADQALAEAERALAEPRMFQPWSADLRASADFVDSHRVWADRTWAEGDSTTGASFLVMLGQEARSGGATDARQAGIVIARDTLAIWSEFAAGRIGL